jgi:hypothetical protein
MAQQRSKKPRRKFNPDRHAERILRGKLMFYTLLGQGNKINGRYVYKKPIAQAIADLFRPNHYAGDPRHV